MPHAWRTEALLEVTALVHQKRTYLFRLEVYPTTPPYTWLTFTRLILLKYTVAARHPWVT